MFPAPHSNAPDSGESKLAELEKSAMGFYRSFAENLRIEGDGCFECSLLGDLLLAAFRYESLFRGFKGASLPPGELLPQASPLMKRAQDLSVAYNCLFRPGAESEQALIYRDLLDVFREQMQIPVRVTFASRARTDSEYVTIRGRVVRDEFSPDYQD